MEEEGSGWPLLTAANDCRFFQYFPGTVGTDLSAVITWAGLGLSAAEPHAL